MGSVDQNFGPNSSADYDPCALMEEIDDLSSDFSPEGDIILDRALLTLFDEGLSLCSLSESNTPSDGNFSDTRSKSSAGSSSGKSLFDSDEEDSIDLYGWRFKPVEEWDEVDTKNWLFRAGAKIGHSYSWMSPQLAIPGKELLGLTREDFIAMDPNFGEKLFDLFRKRAEARNSLSGSEFSSDDVASVGSDNVASDIESAKGSDGGKRRPGRPKNPSKKVKKGRLLLWEFLRNSLYDRKYCPKFIRWENHEERTFRFVKGNEMAKLWAKRDPKNTKNKKMTYENLTRAMRYWYKSEIFDAVRGREHHVYKFGKNATGLKTECPNFDRDYHGHLQ